MNKDDYAADLDAVNIYQRYAKEKSNKIYEICIDYYNGITQSNINRAKEISDNISLESINQYRTIYSDYLLDNDGFKYTLNDTDYINRMNYFDNFVLHLVNNDQAFTPCKYYKYNEY